MCTHPLKAFPIGYTDKGKVKYKITSYNTDHVEQINNTWIACDESFRGSYATRIVRDFEEVPCGHCLECRLKYSRDWADRMVLEAQKYDENYFLTLTYDQDHVPVGEYGMLTLRKKDFQDFMKRLRKAVEPEKIRFYAAGEYGDKTFRPHYHAIVFGLHISDLEHFGFSGDYPVFISEWLRNIWKQGNVMIAPVSWDTCAYTARYVVKKQKGKTAAYYDNLGLTPEFCLMSRRPGLAREYFDEHFDDIYKTDQLIFSTEKGGRIGRPPRYFDKCLESLDEDRYNFIKQCRKEVAEQARTTLLCHTHLSYEEILRRRAAALDARTKVLKRLL